MIIYYNPDCSKCNQALDLLNENQCSVDIRNYLQTPPTAEELKDLLQKLNCNVQDLIRTTEPLFMEQFQDQTLTDDEWLTVLSQHPILIQRPIVIDGEKAIIGRPPQLITTLFQVKK